VVGRVPLAYPDVVVPLDGVAVSTPASALPAGDVPVSGRAIGRTFRCAARDARRDDLLKWCASSCDAACDEARG
jgi:hypothetical protein